MTLNVDDVLARWAALGSDLHRLLGGIENDAEYDEAAGLLEELDRLTEGGVTGPHVVLGALLAKRLVEYDERQGTLSDAVPERPLGFLPIAFEVDLSAPTSADVLRDFEGNDEK